MPVALFRSPSDAAETWRSALQSAMPELEVRIWPEVGDPAEVDYALIWAAPDDLLHQLPNLRLVFSLGAGVDHLIGGAVPQHIPIARLVDPALTEGMVEYVLYQVLRHHRGMDQYEARQQRATWAVHEQVRSGDRGIGVLGLGELGSACARALAGLGFAVAGYSRSRRKRADVTRYAGADEWDAFLAHSEILICLLPLTDATRGVLNAELFSRLPPSAVLIHAGRGQQLVEDDLLSSLEQGHLRHAVLDVFAEEPLPAGHPFWSHPAITVTPHIASQTNPWTGAARVTEGIRRDQNGALPESIIDRERGY